MFVFLHFKITSQYEEQMKRLIVEQDIPQNSSQMILNYYFSVSDIANQEKTKNFTESVNQLNNTYTYLDSNITNAESKK